MPKLSCVPEKFWRKYFPHGANILHGNNRHVIKAIHNLLSDGHGSNEKVKCGARREVVWLRRPPALPEDPTSVPNTMSGSSQLPITPAPGDIAPLLASMGTYTHRPHSHTDTIANT